MPQLPDLLSAGGPIVWLLLVLSLLSLALIAVKAVQLAPVLGGKAARDAALAKWKSGDKAAAVSALAQGKTAADRVTHAAMEGLMAGRNRAALEPDLEWRGNTEIATLRDRISLLELVAMISPLLGLLGTVLGMIQSFQELAAAEGAANASLLAGGIWQALLTTAVGLLVAIPAAVAANMLSARVDRAAETIESAVGHLFAIDSAQD